MIIPYWNKPLASAPFVSYRCKSRYGFVMIGAKSHADAWKEAARSTSQPSDLEMWDGTSYVPAVPSNDPQLEVI